MGAEMRATCSSTCGGASFFQGGALTDLVISCGLCVLKLSEVLAFLFEDV